MTPIYKKVKVLAAHCPDCKEQLRGNGGIAFPFTCKCGEWLSDWITPGHYTVVSIERIKK